MLIYDLYKTSSLSCIIIVLAHNSPQIDHSTRTHHPDSEPTHLSSYFLKLHTWQRSNKYQFCGLRFDQTCDRSMKYHNCGELANHYSTDSQHDRKSKTREQFFVFLRSIFNTFSQSETKYDHGDNVFNRSRWNKEILQCFVFLSSVFDTFSHSANQKQNLTMVTMFFYRLRRNKEIS